MYSNSSSVHQVAPKSYIFMSWPFISWYKQREISDKGMRNTSFLVRIGLISTQKMRHKMFMLNGVEWVELTSSSWSNPDESRGESSMERVYGSSSVKSWSIASPSKSSDKTKEAGRKTITYFVHLSIKKLFVHTNISQIMSKWQHFSHQELCMVFHYVPLCTSIMVFLLGCWMLVIISFVLQLPL